MDNIDQYAFPTNEGNRFDGLTKREYLVVACITAAALGHECNRSPAAIAKRAIQIADSIIAQGGI
jgi:hypothetical protein